MSRSARALAGTAAMALGCTASPVPTAVDWSLSSQPVHLPARPCPYLSTFVEWFPKPLDGAISERTASILTAALEREGFHVVTHRSDAYWIVKSNAQHSFNRAHAPDWIVWSVRTQANLELADLVRLGASPRPASPDRIPMSVPYKRSDSSDGDDESVTASFLGDLPDDEIEPAARFAAREMARILQPHLERKCSDLEAGRRDEQAELERLREELAAEIERVRSARTRQHQERQLDLEPEPSE